MQNNIKKDYFWNTLGVFAQNAISPLLLIVITRINGIYYSGMFSFAFSLSLIFWAIAMWGGRTYQVSDVKKEFLSRSYVIVRIILSLFVFLSTAVFCLANNYDLTKSAIITTLILFKLIESITDSMYGILQSNYKLYIAGKSLLYKSISGILLFILIDIVTKSILLGVISILIINIIIFCFYDLRAVSLYEDLTVKQGQMVESVKKAIVIIKRCFPVFVVSFFSMFSLNIPRYFIDKYRPEDLGYFGILAMPITLIAIVMSFILQPNIVRLSKFYIEKKYIKFNNNIKKIAVVTVIIGLSVLIGTYLVGAPILELAFGISFTGYKLVLIIMVIGGIINSLVSIFINILIVMRSFKPQVYVLLITNILLAFLSQTLINTYGLIGSVVLFATINILQLILLIVVYKVHFMRLAND